MSRNDSKSQPADTPAEPVDVPGADARKKTIAIASEEDTARYGQSHGACESGPEGERTSDADPSAELRAERDAYKDKYLRAQAECANISRRLHQQHAESLKLGGMNLARELLCVLDNLERTLESVDASREDDPIVAGVKLIADDLSRILRDHGVKPIVALDQPFDPALHQAMMQDFVSDASPGTVTIELERGYRMHDRVLRPAKVAVRAEPPKSDEASDTERDDSQ
ncbi:MAG: nucleotide exchange factor GrpE [Phycisphaerae bacterium]